MALIMKVGANLVFARVPGRLVMPEDKRTPGDHKDHLYKKSGLNSPPPPFNGGSKVLPGDLTSMPEQVYIRIDEQVLSGTSRPRPGYFIAIIVLGLGILFAAMSWLAQVKRGMGITNLHQSVDWGVYLSNFIYWVGLAHSGTLISAIFFLARAKWRDAVSRATEAMTIIAILIAGMFPLIHLDRFWVVYFIIPYPSQRQIWSNFTSPLL
jgi:molybdopterin-containing oxidoreductase family membrane subunit